MKTSTLCIVLLTALCLRVHAADEPVPVPDDWKTYSNAAYGFQFRYPPRYQIKEHLHLNRKTVFSAPINSSLFAVGLFLQGEYTGFAVIVDKKEKLQFRSQTIQGFYKFEPSLNTWLGYNPVAAEYTDRTKTYFYVGNLLCLQVDILGADHLPIYTTTSRASKTGPQNDILLTDHDYAFQIPREDAGSEVLLGEDLTEEREQIRNSFAMVPPVQAIKADCNPASLIASSGTLPALSDPKAGQTLDCRKPVPVSFDHPLPDGVGAVFYLDPADASDPDKLVFGPPAGDVRSGQQGQLQCETAGTDTAFGLHVLFYKVIHGRKVLLDKESFRRIPVVVK